MAALIGSPPNSPVDQQDGKGRLTGVSEGYRNFLVAVFNILTGLTSSGTTAERPTNSRLVWIGFLYFDRTLGKPIWIKTTSPVTWVDADGAPA